VATQLSPARPSGARAAGERRPAVRDRWPLLVLLVPLVLVCLPFWPGHMSADTLNQIAQVMSFDLTNQHSPLLVALWKPFFELGAGPGWVLTLQVAAFLTGAYLVLRAALGRLPAAVVASLVALAPPVFGMLGYLSRDTWYTALLVLLFGLVVRAAQDARHRGAWVALAIAAAWLTLAAPSVVLALIPLAALPPALARRGAGVVRRVALATAAGVALTLALMATQSAASAALGVRDVAPEQYLYVYDLAQLSAREDVNHFPPDVMPRERALPALEARVSPDSVVSLVWAPDAPLAPTPMSASRLDSLSDAWRDEVTGEPLEWLDVRVDLLARNLALSAPASFVYHPVIDPNPWGYAPTFPGANASARDYVEAFTTGGDALLGTAVHRVWVYLLVALVAGAALLVRRRDSLALLAVGAFGLSALTFQAGLLAGTPQNNFRLEFPVVVTGLLCAVVALGALRRARSARAAAPAPR
jgi:hypothetical protein